MTSISSMSSTQQKALILPIKQGQFIVGSSSIPKPGPDEVLVKVQAAGLNPVDYKIKLHDFGIEKYPAVLGQDIAGIVEEIGKGVSTLKKGDNIFFSGKLNNNNINAGFQQYCVAAAELTVKIPSSISFDQAASIPVGLSTASVGLYQEGKYGAGLVPPWAKDGKGKYDGPTVVFGGSGSVGAYVQLAKLSGFSPIIATASPQHTAHLKSLGATHVIDRHLDLATLSNEIKKITSAPIQIVYDSVSLPDTQKAAYDLLAPGGTLVLTLTSSLGDTEGDGKRVVYTYGSPHTPLNREVFLGLYPVLTTYLAEGLIKPNLVETLPDGLLGIDNGLERLQKGRVSGVKLIGRPQETK